MPKANGRTDEVRNLLISKGHQMTVQEICAALGYPAKDAKFVSSILVGYEKKGEVTSAGKVPCSVTQRMSKAYLWAVVGGRRPAGRPAAAPKARPAGARQPKAPPPPPPPPKQPKLDPAAQARAEARRRAAEAARKTREAHHQAQQAADRRERAFLTFARITGCHSRDADQMKSAYRKASIKHHPDRGGDQNIMAELNGAWTEISA